MNISALFLGDADVHIKLKFPLSPPDVNDLQAMEEEVRSHLMNVNSGTSAGTDATRLL